MVTARKRVTGQGHLTTRRMKDGRNSCPTLDGSDFDVWVACYRSAITGFVSAQRRTPNPRIISRWCARFADVAVTEALRRRDRRFDDQDLDQQDNDQTG